MSCLKALILCALSLQPPFQDKPPLSSPQTGEGKTYYFGIHPKFDLVYFTSRTEIATHHALTKRLHGTATLNFESGSGKWHLRIPTDSIHTGDRSVDAIVRSEDYFNTARHNIIEFRSIKATKKASRKWEIRGLLTLNGISKNRTIIAEVTPFDEHQGKRVGPGSWLRVKADVNVDIRDHGITLRKDHIGSLNPLIRASLLLLGTTEKNGPPPNLAPLRPPPPPPPRPNYRLQRPKRVSKEGLPGTLYQLGGRPVTEFILSPSGASNDFSAGSHKVGGYVGVDWDKGIGTLRLNLSAWSLTTGNDEHNKAIWSKAWLDAANHQYIECVSQTFIHKNAETWKLTAALTVRGITRMVTAEVRMRKLPVELMKKVKWGDQPGIHLETTFEVSLSEFGIESSEDLGVRGEKAWKVKANLVAIRFVD